MSEDEWLAFRKNGIGGSDVPAILGVSRFKTPHDVWLDKITPEINKIDSPRMKAGRKLESTIADWWAEDYGFQIRRDNKIRIHPTIPILFGDLDRTIISPDRGMGILEAKNTNGRTFKQWEAEGISMDYYFQIQHYFMVMPQVTWGAAAILVDGWDLKSMDLEPNKEIIDMLEAKLVTWWNKYVVPKVPPPPINLNDTKKMYPAPFSLTTITADLMILAKTLDLNAVRNEIDKMKVQEDILTVAIQDFIKENEALVDADGKTLATWKKDKDGKTFDTKTFLKDHFDLYEKYCLPKIGARRFLLKRTKEE
jgi:putative phage-type endonuclease